jgi:hypothetical protein
MKQYAITLATCLVIASVNAVNLQQVNFDEASPSNVAQTGQTVDDPTFEVEPVAEDNKLGEGASSAWGECPC